MFIQKHPLVIPLAAAAIFSFIALGELPYGYYTFLRWVMSGAAVLLAVFAIRWKKLGWLAVSAPIFILFFPAFQVYFEKEVWAPIDVIAGIALIVAGAVLTRPTADK